MLRWLKPLQQALSLEVETGFNNLQGRQQRFDGFLTHHDSPDRALAWLTIVLMACGREVTTDGGNVLGVNEMEAGISS